MKRIGVICHDAGGAEQISYFIKNKELDVCTYLEGPSVKIFKRVLNIDSKLNGNYLIENCNLIIFGTSWQSDLERKYMLIAKERNIKFVVMLDHWIDYKSRLFYESKFLNPDEIWVVDDFAYNKAKKEFKNSKIVIQKNFYLQNMVSQIFSLKRKIDFGNQILFIGENTSQYLEKRYCDQDKWNYDELSSFAFLIKNLNLLNVNSPKLIIRPHPSENKDKYLQLISKFKEFDIKFSENINLAQDISNADIVVGAESMALVVALFAKKRVISSIPIEGKKSSLPFPGIENMIEMIPN